MEFLKTQKRFSFRYGNNNIWESDFEKHVQEDGSDLITTYSFSGGLKVTNIAKKHEKYGAYEWVNILENTGSENTPLISELFDCDCEFPCEYHSSGNSRSRL